MLEYSSYFSLVLHAAQWSLGGDLLGGIYLSASVAAMYPIDDFSYIIFLLYHSYDFVNEHARPVNHYGRRLPASYSWALVSIPSTGGWVSAGVADNSDIAITMATKSEHNDEANSDLPVTKALFGGQLV